MLDEKEASRDSGGVRTEGGHRGGIPEWARAQLYEEWDRAGAEATHFSEARQMTRSLGVLIRGFKEQDVAGDSKR